MESLEAGEKNIKMIRRHFLVLVPLIVFSILAAFAPLILYRMLLAGFLPLNQILQASIVNFVSLWSVFIYSVWLLILWVMFFVEWTDYYLDVLILTTKKIIKVEQKGFFNREVTSFFYAQIQDVTIETNGVINTLFKFGDLHIQTAGHKHEIVVKDAHYPEEAKALILKLGEQSRSN